MNLDQLIHALPLAWCDETSADPDRWTEHTKARGQCAVTALVVQDHLGGDLLRAEIRHWRDTSGNDVESHYWNLLPGGIQVDLTAAQFTNNITRQNTQVRDREYVLSHESTRQRYELLLEILAEQAVPEGTPTDPGTGSKYVYRRRPELPRKSSLAGTLKHAADMATKHERLAAVVEDIVFANRQGKSPDLTQLQTALFELRGYEPRDCPTGCGGISVAQSGGGVACTHCTWWFCY